MLKSSSRMANQMAKMPPTPAGVTGDAVTADSSGNSPVPPWVSALLHETGLIQVLLSLTVVTKYPIEE